MSDIVLFVCQHGAAKSVIAAEHLNRLARSRGLSIRAESAGVEPDPEVPPHVVAGLAADGIEVAGYAPGRVTSARLAAARRTVSVGCDIGAELPPTVERWDDVPMVSDGYAAARAAIVAHVERFLDALAHEHGEPTPLPPTPAGTLVLRRADVARALSMRDCIDAVERAFVRHARAETIPPGVLGAHVHGGGFHIKSAGLLDAVAGRPTFVAKINANFPDNPERSGLPTIQGVVALFDAADGRLLALLDSIEITSLRTAAATAVAAKYLAPESGNVTICGCGEQSRNQLRAIACVRQLRRVMAIDVNAERAARFAAEMSQELDADVAVVADVWAAAATTNIWVTCTPSRRWFLGREHVMPGAFVAAVGADNPEKQEIEPELLAASAVVADVLEQCATIGDLRHAIAAGLMRREDIRAELADVVSGRKPGRRSSDEVIVFDSTGTAIQDVAAASLAYERALAAGVGLSVNLGESA